MIHRFLRLKKHDEFEKPPEAGTSQGPKTGKTDFFILKGNIRVDPSHSRHPCSNTCFSLFLSPSLTEG